ncbi:MAG: hypothetical protein ACREJU_10560, partial [Nitrospiraceae bacterium]
NGAQAQRLGPETTDRLERLDSDATRLPESPNSDPLHRHENLTPESYVPPRSPDLGEPYFPLSPSIGPGSGLLGPEAGRGPARLRSGDERDSRGLSGNPTER